MSPRCSSQSWSPATLLSWTTFRPIALGEVREAVEAAGATLLYLPSYSPDFNPIEMAFAKIKAFLRAAAARTIPDLWDALKNALNAFPPNECRNYFAAAGYDAF